MTASTPIITFEPAEPVGAVDGIQFYVAGTVRPRGRVTVTNDDDSKIHASSEEFGQADSRGQTDEAQDLTVIGSPAGGGFTLSAYTYGDDVEARTPPAPVQTQLGTTGTIARNATVAAVLTALRAAWGADNVYAYGDDLPTGPVHIEFTGDLADTKIGISKADSFSGGSSPRSALHEVTVGGVEDLSTVAGPYRWGPIVLPTGDYTVDLVATADDDDLSISEGDSLLDSTVAVTVS